MSALALSDVDLEVLARAVDQVPAVAAVAVAELPHEGVAAEDETTARKWQSTSPSSLIKQSQE